MESTIQTNLMSLYIPYVHLNISKEYISHIFHDLKYGKVKHIDFIVKMNSKGKMYHSAFVHLDYWYDIISSYNFQDKLLNPAKEARIVYKEPYFWRCFINTSSNKNIKINKYQPKLKITI